MGPTRRVLVLIGEKDAAAPCLALKRIDDDLEVRCTPLDVTDGERVEAMGSARCAGSLCATLRG
jgi:hypothetical protein